MGYFDLMEKLEENKAKYGFRFVHFYPKYLTEHQLREIQRRFMVVKMPDVQGMFMAC